MQATRVGASESSFDPGAFEVFEFSGWRYHRSEARVELHYRLLPGGPTFIETMTFVQPLCTPDEETLAPRIELLHLLAGISYYKTACPPHIVAASPPGPEVAAFIQTVYRQGLGEFAHRNRLAGLHRRIVVPRGRESLRPPSPVADGGVVVPLGGGKDSLVSVDLLERNGVDFRLLSVGRSALIDEVARAAGRPHIRIERSLAPELLALNRRGALNGHVPISAILAAVMLCAGPFYEFDTVVMSNESSAEAANLILEDGFAVNHQYSKTLAFEKAFSDLVVSRIDPGYRYFSLLRDYPELAIGRYFARHCARFHQVFSSCNANFRLQDAAGERWCRACPKCRFVFLMLAPFMDREDLVEIFGGNLLDDPAQIGGYSELLGFGALKPFECVGEIEESRAALGLLRDRPEWRNRAVPAHFLGRLDTPDAEPWYRPTGEGLAPPPFRGFADALG